MSARTWIGGAAVVVFAVGLFVTVAGINRPQPPSRTLVGAVASRAIEPYSLITSDMVAVGEPLPETEARSRGVYPIDAASGLMATARLAPGDRITTANALPVTEVRFVRDLRLEVVSFAAGIDRLVGGRVRPGHRINIYGTGRDSRNRTFTELVERAALVVDVSAAGQAVVDAPAVPDPTTGEVTRAGGARERSVTMVTVALLPARVMALIDALSSRRLEPWVTLAASGQADIAALRPATSPTPVILVPGDTRFAVTVERPQYTMEPTGGGGAFTPSAPTMP